VWAKREAKSLLSESFKALIGKSKMQKDNSSQHFPHSQKSRHIFVNYSFETPTLQGMALNINPPSGQYRVFFTHRSKKFSIPSSSAAHLGSNQKGEKLS
jgi:hypothetical protein